MSAAKIETARCRITRRGSALRCGTARRKLPHSICKKVVRFTSKDACAWKSTLIVMESRDSRWKSRQLICSSSAVEAMSRSRNARHQQAPAVAPPNHQAIYPTTTFRSDAFQLLDVDSNAYSNRGLK